MVAVTMINGPISEVPPSEKIVVPQPSINVVVKNVGFIK